MSLGGGDLQVILRRIRHGFIICDDTELCDKIISQDVENEQRRRTLAKSKSIDIDKNDLLTLLRTEPDFILDELSHSPEWTATNVQVRRVRCETLGRLDEIKTENEAKRKVQVISWQDPRSSKTNNRNADDSIHSGDEDSSSSLFQRRFEPVRPLVQQSPLTALIQSTSQKQNLFIQYAKFDGTSNVGLNQSKRVTVHFKFHKDKLPIIVSSQATVEETIGFICYKYTTENREPTLVHKDPSKYVLYIADDDGQAEEDFPPLTHTKPFGQYDFPHLTLVQPVTQTRTPLSSSSSSSVHNKVSDGDSSIQDSSRSVTPSPSEVRKCVSSSVKVSSSMATASEFPLEADPINTVYQAYESLNQKTYNFDYFIKSGSGKHVKVRIDVSGEQVRFELLEKTSKLPWQQLLLSTHRLVDCVSSAKDASSRKDRVRVHLIFESQQESDGARVFQTYDLESTAEVAEHFREQILHIITLKNPQARDSYEQQQQQQQHEHQRRDTPAKKRRSLFNMIGAGITGSSSSAKS